MQRGRRRRSPERVRSLQGGCAPLTLFSTNAHRRRLRPNTHLGPARVPGRCLDAPLATGERRRRRPDPGNPGRRHDSDQDRGRREQLQFPGNPPGRDLLRAGGLRRGRPERLQADMADLRSPVAGTGDRLNQAVQVERDRRTVRGRLPRTGRAGWSLASARATGAGLPGVAGGACSPSEARFAGMPVSSTPGGRPASSPKGRDDT